MSDVVERLRSWQAASVRIGTDLLDAAAEIESLRARVAELEKDAARLRFIANGWTNAHWESMQRGEWRGCLYCEIERLRRATCEAYSLLIGALPDQEIDDGTWLDRCDAWMDAYPPSYTQTAAQQEGEG